MAYQERSGREEQKRLMEERTRQLKERVRSEAYRDKERIRKFGILRDTAFIIAMLLVFTAAAGFYLHNYRFSTYALNEETALPSARTEEFFSYKDGVIIVGNDSISYIVKGTVKWTAELSVTNPVITIRGDYFSIYDRGAFNIYLCDDTGIVSTIQVSRPVYKTDISASGVSAVITENNDASYISYFNRFGIRLEVEVKTLLDSTGYPLGMAVSPDGQRLAVVYYSTVNGIGESRLLVYDFERGRSENSYVVYSDDSAYLTDTVFVDAFFFDNSHLVVVGDNKLVYLDHEGESFTAVEIPQTEQVYSVFRTDSYFGVVKEAEAGKTCLLYDRLGKKLTEFEAPDYMEIHAAEDAVLFQNGKDLVLYNTAGRRRYEGTLPENPVGIILLPHHKLWICYDTSLQKITLK